MHYAYGISGPNAGVVRLLLSSSKALSGFFHVLHERSLIVLIIIEAAHGLMTCFDPDCQPQDCRVTCRLGWKIIWEGDGQVSTTEIYTSHLVARNRESIIPDFLKELITFHLLSYICRKSKDRPGWEQSGRFPPSTSLSRTGPALTGVHSTAISRLWTCMQSVRRLLNPFMAYLFHLRIYYTCLSCICTSSWHKHQSSDLFSWRPLSGNVLGMNWRSHSSRLI